jgi:hypothetical protein
MFFIQVISRLFEPNTFANVNRNCKVILRNNLSEEVTLVRANQWYGFVSPTENGDFGDGNQVAGIILQPRQQQPREIFMRKRADNATGCTFTFVFEFPDGRQVSVYVSVGFNATNQYGCDSGDVRPQDIAHWDYAPGTQTFNYHGRRIEVNMDNESHAVCYISFHAM